MTLNLSRRELLQALAISGITLPALNLSAFAAESPILDKLRKAGVVKVAMANQPPYSGLNPDGSVTGISPTIVQMIMMKLGVPKVEGIIATYGQLIPGLDAGRWDIIGASLRITGKRCPQVLFADPFVFDGGAIGYLPAEIASPPTSIAEIGRMGLKVGILSGSFLIKKAEGLGVDASNISQFPDNPALIDGLMAKRAKVVLTTNSSLRNLRKARNNAFAINSPLPDDVPAGSSAAFRTVDKELHAAFQRELRALKVSDEFVRLNEKFGFDVPSKDLLKITAEEACAKLS